MKNTQKKALFFLAIVLFVSVRLLAQTPDGPPSDPGVPFDGLSLALVAGVGYGVKKLAKKKKDAKEQQELNK